MDTNFLEPSGSTLPIYVNEHLTRPNELLGGAAMIRRGVEVAFPMLVCSLFLSLV